MRTNIASHRRSGPGGFTLVELLVAVTLIAILAAIAAPTMSRILERADARQTARKMANALRYAHDQAMSRGEHVIVQVNTAVNRGQIQVFRSGGTQNSCQGAAVPAGALPQYEVSVSDVSGRMAVDQIANTTGSGPTDLLCFTPDGRILNTSGNPFHAQGCQRKNWRMFVASQRAIDEGELGSAQRSCLSNATRNELLDRRTARDRVDFWEIHAGYNGSIRAFQ